MSRHGCLPAADTDRGFTLVELLVTAVLAVVVFSVVLSFLSVQLLLARTQPDAADLQQRARIGAEILSTDLTSAGAWADRGGVSRGLVCCVPVLHPRRLGMWLADPPGVARPDVLTVVRASQGTTPGRLRDPLGSDLVVETGNGCVASDPVCGLREDDAVIVFGAAGHHDFFLLGPPGVVSAPLRPRQVAPPQLYGPGAVVVGVDTSTYYFDVANRQLRQYDGNRSDVPIVDDVVALRFEYWGTAGVPPRARAEAGTATCWFDALGGPLFGRAVAAPVAANVRLSLHEFRDGPWCGAGENRFDADLLRIRHVRAVLRVAATSEMSRGSGADFLVSGRATSALRLVPDVEVVIDAAPRNLNADY